MTSNKSSHTKATCERIKKWSQLDSSWDLKINNFISVEETATKNGHGLSLLKDLWTTNTLAQALTTTLSSSSQEDSFHKWILRTEQKSRKAQPLKSRLKFPKNQPSKLKSQWTIKLKPLWDNFKTRNNNWSKRSLNLRKSKKCWRNKKLLWKNNNHKLSSNWRKSYQKQPNHPKTKNHSQPRWLNNLKNHNNHNQRLKRNLPKHPQLSSKQNPQLPNKKNPFQSKKSVK